MTASGQTNVGGQVRRILGLVQSGKLDQGDAAALLSALHPRLNLGAAQRAFIFALLAEEGQTPESVATQLLSITGLDGDRRTAASAARAAYQSQSQQQSGGQQSQSQGSGQGRNWPGMEGFAERVSGFVDSTLGQVMDGLPRPPAPARARPGSLLRLVAESSEGASYKVNLPLGLAEHFPRLIPPAAQTVLASVGLEISALVLLVQAGPPPGELISAEDEHGNEVKLTII